ncbi:hypothetical protein B566_EDAN007031, partial [Ephemera danica]
MKTYALWLLFVSCLILQVDADENLIRPHEQLHVLPKQSELVYGWRADVTTGARLEDMQYSSYNGKVTNEKIPEIETPFLKKCETFGKPFIAHYDGAQSGHYGLKNWCPVEQHLKDVSGNGTIFTLRKFYDTVRCSKRTVFADTLAFKIFRDQTNEVISTTMRNYVIVSKSPDTLMIKEIESRSEMNTQSHGLESEVHFHFTNQKLHIISESEASTENWEIGKTLNGTLEFELTKENVEFGTHPDLTFGAMKHDPKNAVNIKRIISSFAPTNIIRDFFDPDTGMGYTYQELSLEDISGHPTLKYFDLKQYMYGQVSKDLSLYTRGISIDTSFFLGHFNGVWDWRGDANEEIPVSQVLQSLGVTPRKELQDSFEIIFRVRDRTVLCLYYSQISEKEIMEIVQLLGLQDLMTKFTSIREDSPGLLPFNNMIFDMSTALEIVRMNDIGLPVTLFTHHPDMLAFVGNISMNAEGKKTLIKSNLALRFIGQRARGMHTLNPIIGQWQGVMSHVHTTTYSFGEDHSLTELNQSFPQCSNIHAVSSGSPQEINQLKHELLDSEFELTSDLNTSWLIRLFMLWLQMNDLNERLPYFGNCGQSIRIAPKGEARQLVLMWPMGNFDSFFGEAVFKRENGEAIKTWTLEIDMNYNYSVIEKISSSIHIGQKLQENPNYNLLPAGVYATAAKIAAKLHSFLIYTNTGYSTNSLSEANDSNPDENSVIWVNGAKMQRPTQNWDVPNLFKLRAYIESSQKEKKIYVKISESCVAAGGYVLTYDESSV